MSNYMDIIDAMGETAELGGGRGILLPVSLYPMRFSVDMVDVYPPKPDGTGGGNAFVALVGEVLEGPFYDEKNNEGAKCSARLGIQIGRADRWIQFLNHTARVLSGEKPDGNVFKEYNFQFSGDKETAMPEFRAMFEQLSLEDRKEFMVKYLRVNKWDGRAAIASVGQEVTDKKLKDGSPAIYNRWVGFHDLKNTEPKTSRAYINKVCYPKQAAAKAAMLAAGAIVI